MEYRRQRRLVAEINVVPYIDVMLVLLIIFMITAPLITQGVKIELPSAPADVIPPTNEEPIIVSVNAVGEVFIDVGENPDQAVAIAVAGERVAKIVAANPEIDVLIRGDKDVGYGRVVEVMTALQNAGVESVGLITTPIDDENE